MDIHILSPEVVDQIAAGEVVERPSHLVKELVENSLDAGASEIEVQVEQGGRWVKVKDNGSGINRRNLPLAVARHGTSKIQKSSDLWSLQSFGFRGEALASIAAVSRLSLTSQVAGESGYRLITEFGKSQDPEPVGAEVGTTLLIEDLFSNVPARLKFLKGDSAEISQIKNTLKALALANPKVTLRFRTQGKLVFFWPGVETRVARAEQVLEQPKLLSGHYEFDGAHVDVAISAPNVTTGNSRQIWLFAQNRWVQDRSLQAAILDAYRGLLMHGEFPIAVIWISVPPDEIDVNIHPTKSQVKFLKPQTAFRAVNRGVREVLEKAPWVAQDIGVSKTKMAEPTFEPQQFTGGEFERTQYPKREFFKSAGESMSVMETLKTFAPQTTVKYKDDNELDRYLSDESQGQELVIPISDEVISSPRYWSKLNILGQANQTYIVAQNAESLVLVDQHAAHERVVYETLMERWKGGQVDVQQFLLPLTLEMSEDYVEALISQTDEIAKLGVSIEMLTPTSVAVNSAPSLLSESALQLSLNRIAQEVMERGGSFALEKIIGDICATLACHSVVRAGQSLSHEQMQGLLSQMDDFPLSSFCPHGRPVYVEYPFPKIERQFGRIV